MFRVLRTWLSGSRDDYPQRQSDYIEAADAYRKEKLAYDAAKERKDTRAMHDAWDALNAASSDLIRAEIAMRDPRPQRKRSERATPKGRLSFR